ncbi:MAG: hypothetical protein U0525_03760 [Patescibacteria group bacterium]
MATKTAKNNTLSKSSLKVENTDDSEVSVPKRTRKYDHLISFQFKIFNPLKWAMLYLQELQQDRDGKITLRIPFMWYLTFLIFVVGGSSALGALVSGPYAYFQGQMAERGIWLTMPTPTPIVVVPTPAPVLVTRLGVIKATYQVKNLIPSPTPNVISTSSAVFDSQITPTMTPLRYVLIAENNELLFLQVPSSISFNYLLNDRVLVTGLYDVNTKTLSIESSDDVEMLY